MPKIELHLGDVIQKAREKKRWTQTDLGIRAGAYALGAATKPIDKSTVSRVERDPYGSDLATIWRLLAALNLDFCEIERAIGSPFQEARAPSGRKAVGK